MKLKAHKVLFLGLSLALVSASVQASEIIRGSVSKVVDGDTFYLDGLKVRLWGIDAPESKQKCRLDQKSLSCGLEAADYLKNLISGKSVACLIKDVDRYGRRVGDCALVSWECPTIRGLRLDIAGVCGRDIGGTLVFDGWAVDYTAYSKGAYKPLENTARSDRRGIWKTEFELPYQFRHSHGTP